MSKHQNERQPRRPKSCADPRKKYEHYIALARVAATSGDAIAEQNCYQHAEHFLRVMRGE